MKRRYLRLSRNLKDNSMINQSSQDTLVSLSKIVEVKVKVQPDNEMALYAAEAIHATLAMQVQGTLQVTVDEIKQALISFIVLKSNPKLDINAFRKPYLIPSFLYNILSKMEETSSSRARYTIVQLTKDEGFNREAMDKLNNVFASFGKSLPIAVESGFPKGKVRDSEVIRDLLTFRLKDGEQRPLEGIPNPENWRQAVYLGITHVENPTLNEYSYGDSVLAKDYFHEVL